MMKFEDGQYIEMTQEEIDNFEMMKTPIELLQSEIEKLREELIELKGE